MQDQNKQLGVMVVGDSNQFGGVEQVVRWYQTI